MRLHGKEEITYMSTVKSPLQRRINAFSSRVSKIKEQDLYFYLQRIDAIDGARVTIDGESRVMFSSYSVSYTHLDVYKRQG